MHDENKIRPKILYMKYLSGKNYRLYGTYCINACSDLNIVIFGDQFIMEKLLCKYTRVFNGGANGQVVLFKHTKVIRK